MSVLIKGMKPPKSCYVCSWYNKVPCPVSDGKCYYRNERHPSCPLIELPPHGRLADLDKMINDFWDCDSMIIGNYELEKIKTVIEAEGSET